MENCFQNMLMRTLLHLYRVKYGWKLASVRYVGFEVLKAGVIKDPIWDTSHSPVKFNRCSYLAGPHVLPASWLFLAWLNLRTWKQRRKVSQKRRLSPDYTTLQAGILNSSLWSKNWHNSLWKISLSTATAWKTTQGLWRKMVTPMYSLHSLVRFARKPPQWSWCYKWSSFHYVKRRLVPKQPDAERIRAQLPLLAHHVHKSVKKSTGHTLFADVHSPPLLDTAWSECRKGTPTF